MMEISRLTARTEGAERKLVEVPKEIVVAKTAALAEYQSSAEFEQVQCDSFDDGVRTFIFMSGMSTRSGTCRYLVRRLGKRWLSSMHLQRPLCRSLLQSSCLQLTSPLRPLTVLLRSLMKTLLRTQLVVIRELTRTTR